MDNQGPTTVSGSTLNPEINQVVEELCALHDRKGRDYAGPEDTLAGFRDFGWRGVAVRIGDKYHRLKNFVRASFLGEGSSPAVGDETVRDTLCDLALYAVIAVALFDEARAQQEQASRDSGTIRSG